MDSVGDGGAWKNGTEERSSWKRGVYYDLFLVGEEFPCFEHSLEGIRKHFHFFSHKQRKQFLSVMSVYPRSSEVEIFRQDVFWKELLIEKRECNEMLNLRRKRVASRG